MSGVIRKAPQYLPVSNQLVSIYLLPPYITMVLDDDGVLWVKHRSYGWIAQ